MSQQVQPTAGPGAPVSAPATPGLTGAAAQQATLSSASIGSMSDLKQQAPQVYNLMMVSIAEQICNQMQQQQQDLDNMMDEFRREQGES